MKDVMILSGTRTPIGCLGGSLSTVRAPELAAACIRSGLNKAGVRPEEVDEVILGNVVSAGIGQNPARQAGIYGGLPVSVGATTVGKVCGSGLKAVMLAAQAIKTGDSQVVVAGGMESMSLAPYLLPQARQGYRLGNGELVDSMIFDGLWDIYGHQNMGHFGDLCARKYGFSREAQDDFAVRSYTRALRAIREGLFREEITPVEVASRKGSVTVTEDEEPLRFDEPKLRALKPAFSKEGTITAGNASSINDGAAVLVVASSDRCQLRAWRPWARIVGYSTYSTDPPWFTTAPVGAMVRLLDSLAWSKEDVDLFEINEAFAAVTMVAEHDLKLPPDRVNIHGGAVSLGHPIGCSGARILVTLLHALKATGGRRGMASLCIGGGEAVALAVEMIEPTT